MMKNKKSKILLNKKRIKKIIKKAKHKKLLEFKRTAGSYFKVGLNRSFNLKRKRR